MGKYDRLLKQLARQRPPILNKKAREYGRNAARSKRRSRELLFEAGIIDEKGKLRLEYQ